MLVFALARTQKLAPWNQEFTFALCPVTVIGLFRPHPDDPSAVELLPVTLIDRVVPFAPCVSLIGGFVTDAVPDEFHEKLDQEYPLLLTMFPSSAVSWLRQYTGVPVHVGVGVNVLVNVAVGLPMVGVLVNVYVGPVVQPWNCTLVVPNVSVVELPLACIGDMLLTVNVTVEDAPRPSVNANWYGPVPQSDGAPGNDPPQ
jgi:hypothetical protein